jgi:hypothetical protein
VRRPTNGYDLACRHGCTAKCPAFPVNDARDFMQLAETIKPSLGTDVFPFEACQEAMSRVR